MNIIITARKFTAKDHVRERIEKKLSKFEKFFDKDVTVRVVMSLEKGHSIMEITLDYAGMIFRVQQSAEDMSAALDFCIDSLERKIQKNKSKLEKRLKAGAYENDRTEPAAHEEFAVIKTKKFSMKPMDVEEAILQMELLGHNFFVYRDIASESINVVYRRDNGGYGHIVTE